MPHSLLPSTLESREDIKLDLAAEMLRRHGTLRLTAWGTSMLPTVWPGDLLTIQSVAHDEIVAGDIVLILRDRRFLVHRLVERRPVQDSVSWITRGDAMPHNDPPTAACGLLGRVVSVQRANRTLVPRRRLSLLDSALARVLSRADRLRSLTLKIHAARLQAGPKRAGQFLRRVFEEVRKSSSPTPFHISHS